MNYVGSKNRIAKHILPIMLPLREDSMPWVEPFVGGGNLIDKVDGKRYGYDSNHHAIDALKLIRDKPEILPKNNQEFTQDMLDDTHHPAHSLSQIAYRFGGAYGGGWARNSRDDDYVAQAYRNAQKQSPGLKGCHLECADYSSSMVKHSGCLIYCDPPYANTAKYKGQTFDSMKFWELCRSVARDNIVFVSEYSAPDFAKEVWRGELKTNLRTNSGAETRVEKLFQVAV